MRTKPTRSTRHKIRLPTLSTHTHNTHPHTPGFRYRVFVCTAATVPEAIFVSVSLSELFRYRRGGKHVTLVCITRVS